MVGEWVMWRSWQRAAHTDEVNWGPRSEVIAAGTPKRATQWWSRAEAQAAADVEVRGTASGQRVVRSMMVSRYVKPLDIGRGPTRSM